MTEDQSIESLQRQLDEARAEVARLTPRLERGAGWLSDGDTLVSGETALAGIEQLVAQSAELRKLMEADGEMTKLYLPDENGVQVEIQHWAIRVLGASLLHSFKDIGAVNFAVYHIPSEEGPLEVTIRKEEGKTPAEVCAELRTEVEKLTKANLDLVARLDEAGRELERLRSGSCDEGCRISRMLREDAESLGDVITEG